MTQHQTKISSRYWVVGGLILVAGIIVLFAYQSGNSSRQAIVSQSYRADTKEKPVLVIEPENRIRDLGAMKADEERTGEFTLRNTGTRPLTISRLRTSCMCTFGQITAGDKVSPLVNMEMNNPPSAKKWRLEIGPGETAYAKVVYRPVLMPVQGPVERSLLFETTDPLNPSAELTIKALVEL